MVTFRIAMIDGDGVGPEVAEAVRMFLEHLSSRTSSRFETTNFDWNSSRYLAQGRVMPENGLELLGEYDAIFLGAIGDPRVPDHITLRQLIFAIRQGFDQYVNLRPVRLLAGVSSPLVGRGAQDFDITFVRENSEGEYSGAGEFRDVGTPAESALQIGVFTRRGIERVMRYAFELARTTQRPLQSVSKANALNYSMVLWDEVFRVVASEYPDVKSESLLVDAAALHMVQNPGRFGVVVASNLFGDILSDLGAALVGGLGLAASANLNPERVHPSMFESVHGSAPDIAGRGIANPMAALWAAGMMVGHLVNPNWESATLSAIEHVLGAGEVRTPDLGGTSGTLDVASAVLDAFDASGLR